jgi:hypothetical protein
MAEKKEFLQGRRPVTFVDLFAGAGGISEGFMQACTDDKYYDFVLASDINENCELTHRVRYNEQLGLGTKFITDGRRSLWIDLEQFSYGEPEWDLGWMWTICNQIDGKRSDFILHLTPDTLKAHWSVFIATYLGTDDQAVIGDYTRRLMAYYAVRLPYMLDLLVQGRLPEDALQQLPKVIG